MVGVTGRVVTVVEKVFTGSLVTAVEKVLTGRVFLIVAEEV